MTQQNNTAPMGLPTNDEVYAEVCRERGNNSFYVSTNAVNDTMAAVRRLTERAAIPEAGEVRRADEKAGGLWQHIPGNFTTHRTAWRDAITECINVELAKGNHDQAAYWNHELEAYDRSFARLLDNPEPVRSAGEPSDQQIIELHDKMYPRVEFDREKIMGNVVKFARALLAIRPTAADAGGQKPHAYEFWDGDADNGRDESFAVFSSKDPATGEPDHQGHIWKSMPLYTRPADAGK